MPTPWSSSPNKQKGLPLADVQNGRCMRHTLFQSLMMFCCIFAAATIASSSYQLLSGIESDTNIHILLRGMIALVGVTVWQLILKCNFKFKPLNIIVPYAISLILVFCIVFVTGLFEELHKDAYRDIFLNFTVVFVVITAVVHIVPAIKNKKH
ncbi:MAG: hypothetical protein LBU48_07860 [Coriobacteriales bacterium]|jgi:hypothetical protein|nr:hypothetical protein [Coriobacteriales bacterium]